MGLGAAVGGGRGRRRHPWPSTQPPRPPHRGRHAAAPRSRGLVSLGTTQAPAAAPHARHPPAQGGAASWERLAAHTPHQPWRGERSARRAKQPPWGTPWGAHSLEGRCAVAWSPEDGGGGGGRRSGKRCCPLPQETATRISRSPDAARPGCPETYLVPVARGPVLGAPPAPTAGRCRHEGRGILSVWGGGRGRGCNAGCSLGARARWAGLPSATGHPALKGGHRAPPHRARGHPASRARTHQLIYCSNPAIRPP